MYYRLDNQSGPVVVFTHGMTMSHEMFEQQFAAVRQAGYRVLAWDVRGHGRSKPMGQDITIGLAAEDLRAIMDHAGIDRALHFGHSMGGMIIQELIFRFPERARAALILGSLCITARQPWFVNLIKPLSRIGFWLCPLPILHKLAGLCAGTGPWARQNAERLARQINRQEFLKIWNAICSCDHFEPDYQLQLPMMICHGSHDYWVGLGTIPLLSRKWVRSLPDARFAVIPDAGHNACGDNPDEFNQILIQFLDSCHTE